MAIRGRGRRRLGAVAWVAVLAALCASGPERAAEVGAASDLGPLPADRYASTAQDYQRSERATALPVRQCMVGRGHPDFPVDARFPGRTVSVTMVSTDYGVLDLGAPHRWGYGWDPEKHSAAQPQGRVMTAAERAALPACDAEASRRLMRGVDARGALAYGRIRAPQVDAQVERDPRVRAAWDVWSRCVAAKGFARCPDPVAAYTDTAWQRGSDSDTRHTRRERATAVADVTCKRLHRTAEIWHGVRARKQTADIALHRAGYAAGLKALETFRATVAEVLRSLG
ncbi:hypothetical protein V2S66_29820 [Streptomyces sp. V4-01]|uniref:Secreted protein n=1 Tax=Actinacidiphila polyblastidii TaxID=3110430 RepID=A0ABU7PJZ3_9ACTN|nr:hypothetical protein [Streptomyces sp. V4-01]